MIRRDCYYYSWGGDLNKGFAPYSKEKGAKCFFFNEFFIGDLNCERCRCFIKENKMKTLSKGGKMKREDFDFEEVFKWGNRSLEFIQKTVSSRELEKLNRKQLRALVVKKWKEIKLRDIIRDGIELSQKSERIIIKTITDAFFATIKNQEKVMKAIQEKLKEKKKKV